MTRHPAFVLAAALAVFLVAAPDARANDKTYKNDAIVDGSNANVQAGFVKNEIAASVFRVEAGDGTVFLQRARVLFFNAIGLATTRNMRILVYGTGNLNPGAPIYTSPVFTFFPGGENLVDLSAAKIELPAGQFFTIGARFEQEGLFENLSSVVTDTNGITPNKNRIFNVSTGQWQTAESLGVTGDFGIRVDVTANGPTHYGAGVAGSNGVPTIDTTGAWKVGNTAFTFAGTNGPANSVAFLGVAEGSFSFPILSIVVLIDPATSFSIQGPTNAAGSWSISTPIPPNPLLAGLHFYGQVFFADAAGPEGLTVSDGIDILICP